MVHNLTVHIDVVMALGLKFKSAATGNTQGRRATVEANNTKRARSEELMPSVFSPRKKGKMKADDNELTRVIAGYEDELSVPCEYSQPASVQNVQWANSVTSHPLQMLRLIVSLSLSRIVKLPTQAPCITVWRRIAQTHVATPSAEIVNGNGNSASKMYVQFQATFILDFISFCHCLK
jgi:hypothetical protein